MCSSSPPINTFASLRFFPNFSPRFTFNSSLFLSLSLLRAMSTARQSSNGGGDATRRPRFVHGGGGDPCLSIDEDRRRLERDSESCSSSSIGRNSDQSGGLSDGEDSGGDAEVQSSFKGPLDTMDALEEVLPVKRGISKFYSGKSKSFTSLADAASFSSLKDIAKPENPYNKKRKDLLLLPRANLRSLQKKPANFNRSAFLPSEATASNRQESSSVSASLSCCTLPPLHPHGKRTSPVESSSPPQRQSPWRSFSLSDLQSVDA